MSPEEFVQRYQADVAGAVCAVQQVVPSMKEKKEGTILFTGGGLALETDGIYIGIVNIKGNIGSDNYYSPENIAKVFYQLYEEKNTVEITIKEAI